MMSLLFYNVVGYRIGGFLMVIKEGTNVIIGNATVKEHLPTQEISFIAKTFFCIITTYNKEIFLFFASSTISLDQSDD